MFPHKEEIIATILDFCKPEKIVLFGSRAKGNFTKHSDIDLAIFLRKELSRRQKRLLKERLDIVAGIYSVDIVFSDEFEEKLKEEVNKTGVVVWKR
jgi:predicted nucleotidyltransferase